MKNRTAKIFFIIAMFYFVAFFSHTFLLNKTVYGDGVFYYSWLRSAVVDHDTNFTNEYAHFDVRQPVTPLGLPGNKYSVGPAILWLPGFLWVHAVMRATGHELPYQLTVGAMSVGYALAGLLLLYRLLRAHFSDTISIGVIIATAGATNLLFYGAVDVVNSHAVSFFAVALFLSLLFSKQKNHFAIGAALGLIGLVRIQDLIFGILILPVFARPGLARLQGRALRKFTLGFFLIFFPQLIAWYTTTGSIANPYLSGGEGFDFLHPHMLGVLFSPENGLFLWTPVVLFGVMGLFLKPYAHRSMTHELSTKHFLFIVFTQLILISSWSSWTQGASYSGRMFVSILPLVTFGLANLFTKLRKIKLTGKLLYLSTILPLSLINTILIVWFLWKNP